MILPSFIGSSAPVSIAYTYNAPPNNKNRKLVITRIVVKEYIFFCASRRFLHDKFFCIMSWSNPVMAIAINIPPKKCFGKNNLEFGSSKNKIFDMECPLVVVAAVILSYNPTKSTCNTFAMIIVQIITELMRKIV